MSENQQNQKSKSNVLAKFLDDSFCDPQAIDIFKAIGTSETNVDKLLGTSCLVLGGVDVTETPQLDSGIDMDSTSKLDQSLRSEDDLDSNLDAVAEIEATDTEQDDPSIVDDPLGLVDSAPEVDAESMDLGSRDDVYEAMLKLQDLIRVRKDATPAAKPAVAVDD